MRYRIMTVSLIVVVIITVFQISLVLAATSANPSSDEGGWDWNTDYNAWSGMAGGVPAMLSGSHNVLNIDTYEHGVGFTTSIISPTISPGGAKTNLIYLPMVMKEGARTYYIDATGGNDSNNGRSPDQAWRTLRKVYTEFSKGTFSGGDSILFKRGGTWTATAQGRLRVWNVAGTSSTNPLYIGAYGTGSKPKIDGKGAVWTWLLGSHTSDGAIDHVVVEDLAITGSNAQSVYLYGVQGWTLRNLDLGELGNSKGNAIIIRRSSHVILDSCNITASGVEGREAVYIGDANDVRDQPNYIYITNCYIHDSTLECIDLKPGCHHITIEGNVLANAGNEVVSLRGDYHIVRGNVISNPSGSMGICGWDSQGEGWLIENNLIKDIHGQSQGGNGEGIKLYGANHTVRNNTVADCADAALKIHASGVTVRNNIFYRSKVGIDLGSGCRLPNSDYNSFHFLTSGLYLASYGGSQTISTACSRRGIECHSITSNPNFLDEIDYKIDPSSPCYHAGDNGSSIGYYEPGPPPSTPTPTPTQTPLPTFTPTPTDTPLPTNTPPLAPTSTPTPTPTQTPLSTFTPTPTDTPLPANTPTLTPTSTPTPTPTQTPLSTFTPTPTDTPTLASTSTPTPTPTQTPASINTPLSMGRSTPTPDATVTSTFVKLSIDEPLFAGAMVVKGNGISEALVIVRDLDDLRIVAEGSVNNGGQYEVDLTSVLAKYQLGGLETGHRIQAESEGQIYQASVQSRITVQVFLPFVSKSSFSNPGDRDYPDAPPR